MYKLSRVHPPDKKVLEDISLSFLPGAKIGVLGPNGSGKSTLLRIMAGQDTDFRGDAQLAPGATVGLLEQEPQLDPSKDVRGNVEDGVRELRDMLDRFNELAANYSDETAGEFSRAPGRDRRRRHLGPRHHARDRDGRAAAAARRRRRGDAVRRRAPPRGALPAAARGARPAAARRADQPPRRRVRGLAREAPRGVQGHRRGRDPRPLLPRQRGRLDPRARPRPRPALQGQLHGLARAEAGAARPRGAARERPPAHDRARARVGARVAEGAAHEGARPAQALRGAARRGAQREARPGADPHPGRAAARLRGARDRGPAQGLRRPAADRGPVVLAAAGRASSA